MAGLPDTPVRAAASGHTATVQVLLAAPNLSTQVLASAAQAAAAAGHAELAAGVLRNALVAHEGPAQDAATAFAVLADQSVAAAVLGLLGGCQRCDQRKESTVARAAAAHDRYCRDPPAAAASIVKQLQRKPCGQYWAAGCWPGV